MRPPSATARSFAEDLRDLGLSYDLFTRTTTRNHYRVMQDLFRTLYEKGYIVEETTLGRVLRHDRPHASRPLHRGNVPDLRLRVRLAATSATTAGTSSTRRPDRTRARRSTASRPCSGKTKHLFLDLPAFAEQLTEWIEGQDHWRPNVRNFSLGLLKELKPRADHARPRLGRADSRAPGTRSCDDKRIYVWFDAVIGYLSASVEWAREPRHARRLARLVAGPRTRATSTSWARTTSSSTP